MSVKSRLFLKFGDVHLKQLSAKVCVFQASGVTGSVKPSSYVIKAGFCLSSVWGKLWVFWVKTCLSSVFSLRTRWSWIPLGHFIIWFTSELCRAVVQPNCRFTTGWFCVWTWFCAPTRTSLCSPRMAGLLCFISTGFSKISNGSGSEPCYYLDLAIIWSIYRDRSLYDQNSSKWW